MIQSMIMSTQVHIIYQNNRVQFSDPLWYRWPNVGPVAHWLYEHFQGRIFFYQRPGFENPGVLIWQAAELCYEEKNSIKIYETAYTLHAMYGQIGETWRLHLGYEYKMIDTKVCGKHYILFYFTRV